MIIAAGVVELNKLLSQEWWVYAVVGVLLALLVVACCFFYKRRGLIRLPAKSILRQSLLGGFENMPDAVLGRNDVVERWAEAQVAREDNASGGGGVLSDDLTPIPRASHSPQVAVTRGGGRRLRKGVVKREAPVFFRKEHVSDMQPEHSQEQEPLGPGS